MSVLEDDQTLAVIAKMQRNDLRRAGPVASVAYQIYRELGRHNRIKLLGSALFLKTRELRKRHEKAAKRLHHSGHADKVGAFVRVIVEEARKRAGHARKVFIAELTTDFAWHLFDRWLGSKAVEFTDAPAALKPTFDERMMTALEEDHHRVLTTACFGGGLRKAAMKLAPTLSAPYLIACEIAFRASPTDSWFREFKDPPAPVIRAVATWSILMTDAPRWSAITSMAERIGG